MQVELNEEGYTLDGKWKLVPVEEDSKMLDAGVAMALCVKVSGEGGWTNYIYALYAQLLKNSPKPDLSGLQSVKGIHVGGEITSEFEKAGKEMWCKSCGSGVGFEDHLPSCPTLKSKL